MLPTNFLRGTGVRKVVTAGRENYYTFRPEEVGRMGN